MLDGVPALRGMGDLGTAPQPKHAFANCRQSVIPTLPNGEYKQGAIPPFAKLLCFLLNKQPTIIKYGMQVFQYAAQTPVFHIQTLRVAASAESIQSLT